VVPVSVTVVSIAALIISVAIGFLTRINLGIICVGAAFLTGFFLHGMNPADIYMKGFPIKLFFLLLGTTLFASIAKSNGTYAELAKPISYIARGNRKVVCIVTYVASFIFSALGMGTVVTPAIMLPLMLEAARKNEVPEFLSVILTLSGSIAGGLSALAPTGLLGAELSHGIGVDEYSSIYLASVITFTLHGLILFLVFGGARLTRLERKTDEPMILNGGQFFTIMAVFGVITAILGFKLDLGLSSFVGSTLLLMCKVADQDKAIAGVEWNTLLLVGGVSMLFYIVSASGGVSSLVTHLTENMSPKTAGAFTVLMAGAMSLVSSSSAVVMPTLIPMVPEITESLGNNSVSPIFLIAAIIIGAHSVAYSPVSTMGAIGMASSSTEIDKHKMFTKLLLVAATMLLITSLFFLAGFFDMLKGIE
jgi:Na+/H+ antiporter NhaD/arsenite permease-like protein